MSAYAQALQELSAEHEAVEGRLREELQRAHSQQSESKRYQEELEAVVQRIALRMIPPCSPDQEQHHAGSTSGQGKSSRG